MKRHRQIERRQGVPFIRPSRSAASRAVVIDFEPFGPSMEVRVDPPVVGAREYAREFEGERMAKIYAVALGRLLKIPVVDRVAQ
jgi:hypothetical protein